MKRGKGRKNKCMAAGYSFKKFISCFFHVKCRFLKTTWNILGKQLQINLCTVHTNLELPVLK